MNIFFLILIVLLFLSGLFDKIPWKINVPAMVGLAVVWIIVLYNNLISLRNRTQEAWADIETQLKRRYDLIPNLVSSVKGYTKHEAGTFKQITEARASAIGAQNMKEHIQAENMLSDALKSLFAVAEAYPDLKANQNFLSLQNELSDTENKIQSARRFYNGNVRDLNTSIQSFPVNIIAGLFKFKEMEFFDLEDNHPAQNPVEVKF